MHSRISTIAAILVATASFTIVWAQSPDATTTAAPTSTPAKAPIEVGVQKVHLSLADLRTVGLDLKNVLKATSSLYDEVTIQPVQLVTEPEVIGFGTVINIPISTQVVGPPEPARKDRVDLQMSHIKPTVSMLKANVDAFISGQKQLDLPDPIQKQIEPDVTTWVNTVNQLATQEGQLEKLTQGPPYDQPTIASDCVAMESNIKELDKTRRSIYKVLKKHAKELNISMQ